jgi:hypothetical protein
VVLFVLSVLAGLLDAILGYVLFDMEIKGTDVRDIVRGAVFAAVWTAYMKQSKRVANTFVKD